MSRARKSHFIEKKSFLFITCSEQTCRQNIPKQQKRCPPSWFSRFTTFTHSVVYEHPLTVYRVTDRHHVAVGCEINESNRAFNGYSPIHYALFLYI